MHWKSTNVSWKININLYIILAEDFDDETVDRKQISVSDIKTKANIEEFFNRTYGQNSGNSSNSINFDENRKFSVGMLNYY